jgi:hypothetical protein
MDVDGGSSSTISTGARTTPGRPARHGGEFTFFLGRFSTISVGVGCKILGGTV